MVCTAKAYRPIPGAGHLARMVTEIGAAMSLAESRTAYGKVVLIP